MFIIIYVYYISVLLNLLLVLLLSFHKQSIGVFTLAISHTINCSKGNHDALSVDDMGDGTLVLSSEEGSVSLSIDQLHAAVVALSPRYPVAN